MQDLSSLSAYIVQKESEVNDTQVTGFCNRIFCAKSKCKEHILC